MIPVPQHFSYLLLYTVMMPFSLDPEIYKTLILTDVMEEEVEV